MERSGRIPTGMAGLLALLVLLALSSMLEWRAEEQGFTQIDPSRVEIVGEDWVPPGWDAWLARRLHEFGPVSAEDDAGIARIVAAVEQSPFVARVESARIVWPDGLDLEVQLREPVACVLIGDGYMRVSADGVLLPGHSVSLPVRGLAPLPVIGPNEWSFEHLRPGDRLVEERHLDALAIASSMQHSLSLRERLRLGPALIDATDSARTSPTISGAHLLLEQRRLVIFGRSPRNDSPGGLPVEAKWRHLAAALELLHGDQVQDWSLVDVRWDRAKLRPRVGYLDRAGADDYTANQPAVDPLGSLDLR